MSNNLYDIIGKLQKLEKQKPVVKEEYKNLSPEARRIMKEVDEAERRKNSKGKK